MPASGAAATSRAVRSSRRAESSCAHPASAHATVTTPARVQRIGTLWRATSAPTTDGQTWAATVDYGDGSGVRWGVRLIHGVELLDNVNGTDFVPRLFESRAGQGFKSFLLGGTEEMNERAAAQVRARFPGFELVGRHHGYLDAAASEQVVEAINAAAPHVLLVGMGNPIQERWIDTWRPRLRVPVCLAIGGLFAYWSGDLDRAPVWMRRLGIEWIHLLIRQPRKAGRYLIGNPLFMARVAAQRFRARR